jgi:inosine/xanthosine triphosphate pyrophosphatase family protein
MLVLGTTNHGKLRELLELLEPHGIGCTCLAGFAAAVDVD